MTYEEVKMWSKMMAGISIRELNIIIHIALSEIQDLEVYEDEDENL